jgi:phosphatidylglycerophosphate synthase
MIVLIVLTRRYQNLDALDGKQARRTGNSTPLGELFDHGCDAITTSVR